MEFSNYAYLIHKNMTLQYCRCLRRIGNKQYFEAGLDGYTTTAYKGAIVNAYNSGCITTDEALHLLEELKGYLQCIAIKMEDAQENYYAKQLSYKQ